jgi:uncharacterized protein (TIGR00725 family)
MAAEFLTVPIAGASVGQHKLRLAEMFSDDVRMGLELQEQVGPWIAHIGSSAPQPGSPTYNAAQTTGRLIVNTLHLPVATGGATGTMEAANRGAMEAGGTSVGIYLEGLPTEQNLNPYCTHVVRCRTLLARQHLLLSGACGVVVASEGGWGTIFEIGHQLIEMRRHAFDPSCPIVIIHEKELWHGFRDWMNNELVGRGLWHTSEYNKLSFVRSPEEAVRVLSQRLAAIRITECA